MGGNTVTCMFTVTVIDDEAPEIINCPSSLQSIADNDSDKTVVTWDDIIATDNADSNDVSGEAFHVGVTNVTFTATDAAGNADVCNFVVDIIDAQAPLISNCPTQDLSVGTDIGSNTATVTWATISASDAVDGPVDVTASAVS